MRTIGPVAALLAVGVAWAQTSPAVQVEVVKYDALAAAVRKEKGRVVVVDVWADYCVPCKRKFPELVRLHEQYAKNGLTAVSVSVDESTADAKERVTRFLRSQRAAFANFLLDERPEVWQNKFRTDGPPCVVVFNRKGELARRFVDGEVDYAEIEKLAVKLLRE